MATSAPPLLHPLAADLDRASARPAAWSALSDGLPVTLPAGVGTLRADENANAILTRLTRPRRKDAIPSFTFEQDFLFFPGQG
jgi:hypothetical protein